MHNDECHVIIGVQKGPLEHQWVLLQLRVAVSAAQAMYGSLAAILVGSNGFCYSPPGVALGYTLLRTEPS